MGIMNFEHKPAQRGSQSNLTARPSVHHPEGCFAISVKNFTLLICWPYMVATMMLFELFARERGNKKGVSWAQILAVPASPGTVVLPCPHARFLHEDLFGLVAYCQDSALKDGRCHESQIEVWLS